MTEKAFNFNALTPDFMWYALESIGIRAESGFLPLNSYENRVYQFTDEERQRYVVKFYRPERWSELQIQEEHDFTLELHDAEVPVAPPCRINGHTLHQYQGYLFALFVSVGGRQFEVDNLDQLEGVGRFLGRIHQVGQQRTFAHRPTISLDEYLHQPKKLLENSTFIPMHLENAFFSDLDLLISRLEAQWQPNVDIIRLHGDCHPGNILWRDGPMFVDLDDARNGPAVQDLWMLLSGDRTEKLAQLDIVLEAYQEFCDFDHSQLKLIEPLRGLRMVYYMAWLAKRWQDPAFPIAFPWFNDPKYWESQVLGFKEQIAALSEPSLSLTPQW
ncbi:serine/threonine protein kinase [Vibrio genomosp. F10]|uniref:Stress response kinase A n=2 Tax=Vibrio genomosp. F10 TaxID=723171 RepID=A0A1B9QVU8_9VIBR|nr:serine/threonine protein kinase [Vibrio genomosp. F10]OCH73311.1 stress response serine/threonine protein kinase YihE [Vibrio genomosp. F10]OEE34744.1 stress response serine/threonine protein kinase YihE [Vibrio genomosp. F10 str. ZF-129]OEE82876.1 stress response serine/threonine protein kinase YihE [Vibrio genomosp. F10 str. 9ZD137]OEE93511.1 stress response serine/threonine protein kinase YihE [Vibrio genomosp. F10 str. 9ZC157]OEF07980.1 stress response serine/threonine protein kinase Yi